jgi:putative addiction module component (TIGR02574 family)
MFYRPAPECIEILRVLHSSQDLDALFAKEGATEQLLAEALQLSPERRAALARELIQSLDSQIEEDAEATWSAEIRRRVELLDSSSAQTVSWSEASPNSRSRTPVTRTLEIL